MPADGRLRPASGNGVGFVAEEVAAVEPLLATYDGVAAAPSVKYRRLTALVAADRCE